MRDPALAAQIAKPELVITGQVHPSAAGALLAKIPTGLEAAAILQAQGLSTVRVSESDTVRIGTSAEFLGVYAPEARESAENLHANLKRPGYRLMLVEQDQRGTALIAGASGAGVRGDQAIGLLSGERFESGLAVIDYHTLLEAPETKEQARAGRALLRPFVDDMLPRALFVEATDPKMQAAYEKIGFKVIARPPKGARRGERLTMLVLPITDDVQQQMCSASGRADLMKRLRSEWYEKNWSGISGAAHQPAKEALEQMEKAAKAGKLIWIQRLPKLSEPEAQMTRLQWVFRETADATLKHNFDAVERALKAGGQVAVRGPAEELARLGRALRVAEYTFELRWSQQEVVAYPKAKSGASGTYYPRGIAPDTYSRENGALTPRPVHGA